MAATKYQVLYRYINEATNTSITNSMDNEYEEVSEFYTDPDHRIFSSDSATQGEAIDEQQEMISYGNSGDNPKTNMLFAYNGTKKVKHKKWVEETTGCVVRDWTQINRNLIGNQGDFTKNFTTLNAATPEDGGLVVLINQNLLSKYFSGVTVATSGSYTTNQMAEKIKMATYFKLKDDPYDGIEKYGTRHTSTVTIYGRYTSTVIATLFINPPITIDNPQAVSVSGYNYYSHIEKTFTGYNSNSQLYSKFSISTAQIETISVPGHYAEINTNPYMIKDTYKRIQLSPWFVNSTYGSLESALERVKLLVDMIGLDNVKLVKIVPFDQFIKIK